MKKLFWLLFLFPIFFVRVKANEIFYSEYGEYSEYGTDIILTSDIIDVQEEIRYRWYKENKRLGNYELYNKTDIFDENSCYFTEFTTWSDDKVPSSSSSEVDMRTRYQYTMAKEIRYLHLTNLYGSYGSIRLPELRVKIDGKEIPYQYTCIGCQAGFDDTIHNGVDNVNESYIDNGGSLIIDLGTVYPVNKIELEFFVFDVGERNTEYTLGYSKDKNNMYAMKNFSIEREGYWTNRINKRNHYIYDLGLPLESWQELIITYTPFLSDYLLDSQEVIEYRYRDKWCQKYDIIKEYLDGFYNGPQGDYNQSGEEQVYYRYRTRDRLEIANNLIIEDIDFDIRKFVIASTNDYEVIANIDYQKNGVYPILFKSGTIEILKEVYVKIDDNVIREYQEEIKRLQNQLNRIQEEAENKKQEYEETFKKMNAQIIELQQQLVNCQNNCQDMEECLMQKLKDKDKQLKQYEDHIFELSNQMNTMQIQLQGAIEKVKELQVENAEWQKMYDELLNLQDAMKKANQQLIEEYKGKLQLSWNINDVYYEKIKELEEQLRSQNGQVNIAITSKEDIITKLNEKIAFLQQELHNMNGYYTQYQEMSQKLEDRNKETVQLQNKMNDYILKINGEETIDLFWIYMGIIFLLIVVLFIKKRKKSNVKKD